MERHDDRGEVRDGAVALGRPGTHDSVAPRGPRSRIANFWSQPWVRTLAPATALLAVYLLTAQTHGKEVNDVVSSNLEAWRISGTGSPFLDGLSLGSVTHHTARYLWSGTADGHVVIFRSPGAVAVALPPYAASHLLGGDNFSNTPGGIWAAILAAVSVVTLMSSVSRLLPRRVVLSVGAVVGLATPIWSVDANILWPHALTVVGISAMAWAASRERWWLLGLFGGVALWGRLHTVVIIAILGLGLSLWRRRPSILVATALPSALLLGAASLWTHWIYNSWRPTGGYGGVNSYASAVDDHSIWYYATNEAGLLISPDRGLLIWTPVLVLVAPAVVRSWSRLPDWTRLLLLGGVVYTFIQGLIDVFPGGSGFYGYRLTLELLVCVTPASALSLGALGAIARRLLIPVCAVQFAVISFGATFQGFLLDDSAGGAWRDNSVALAVRAEPLTIVWLCTFLVLALLLAAVLRERSWLPSMPDPPDVETDVDRARAAESGGLDARTGDRSHQP